MFTLMDAHLYIKSGSSIEVLGEVSNHTSRARGLVLEVVSANRRLKIGDDRKLTTKDRCENICWSLYDQTPKKFRVEGAVFGEYH